MIQVTYYRATKQIECSGNAVAGTPLGRDSTAAVRADPWDGRRTSIAPATLQAGLEWPYPWSGRGMRPRNSRERLPAIRHFQRQWHTELCDLDGIPRFSAG